jgi:hypothetical protein
MLKLGGAGIAMPKLIDLTGQQYGLLKVIKRDETKRGKYVYWICECQCKDKNIVSVRGEHLKSGNTVSCGCVNQKNIHAKKRNSIDIAGRHFGNLTAKYYVNSGKRGTIWHCECKCGNSIDVYLTDLTSGNTSSCGCLEEKNRKEQNEKLKEMMIDDTNISIIRKKEPNKNNTTGIRGVSWCASKQKYIATITFKKKRYYLCSSTDIDVCKNARKEAEEQMYGDFLKWYEKNKKPLDESKENEDG